MDWHYEGFQCQTRQTYYRGTTSSSLPHTHRLITKSGKSASLVACCVRKHCLETFPKQGPRSKRSPCRNRVVSTASTWIRGFRYTRGTSTEPVSIEELRAKVPRHVKPRASRATAPTWTCSFRRCDSRNFLEDGGYAARQQDVQPDEAARREKSCFSRLGPNPFDTIYELRRGAAVCAVMTAWAFRLLCGPLTVMASIAWNIGTVDLHGEFRFCVPVLNERRA